MSPLRIMCVERWQSQPKEGGRDRDVTFETSVLTRRTKKSLPAGWDDEELG